MYANMCIKWIIEGPLTQFDFRTWKALTVDTMFRNVGSGKKRGQNNDGYEEDSVPKKRRKGKPGRKHVQPLGEMARREEQR
jgi:hypothetical protein